MAKENLSQDEKDFLKADLDKLISTNLPDEIDGMTDATSELPSLPSTKGKYVAMKNGAQKKAEKTINSLLKFYLSEDIIEEEDYIRYRADFSKQQLSSMIYSMERIELNIERMMETMDNGELTARMFEVIGGLEKTLLEIIRSQTLYMAAVEENAKMMSRDYDVYKNTKQPSTNISNSLDADSGVSMRGTKDLMKSIQSAINDKDKKENNEDETSETV
jgi:hypothetical protein